MAESRPDLAPAVEASRLVAYQLRFEIPDLVTITPIAPILPEEWGEALLTHHRLTGTVTDVQPDRVPKASAWWVRGIHLAVVTPGLDVVSTLLADLFEQPATTQQVKSAIAVVRGHIGDILGNGGDDS